MLSVAMVSNKQPQNAPRSENTRECMYYISRSIYVHFYLHLFVLGLYWWFYIAYYKFGLSVCAAHLMFIQC